VHAYNKNGFAVDAKPLAYSLNYPRLKDIPFTCAYWGLVALNTDFT